MDAKTLVGLIDRFMEGDQSVSSAQSLEAGIDQAFPDDEVMQGTVLMLASYRPGGGEYLYDEGQMVVQLAMARNHLLALIA